MLVFYADDADDGNIEFIVSFKDIAGNPGKAISQATDSKSIVVDGTEPELSEVTLFTSNKYDSTLAIKGDSVFLDFKSSENIRDLKVILNSKEAQIYEELELEFVFYHVFTESDSEGVIPIKIEYKDLAGNLGEVIEETSDDSEVNYDMTPPAEFKVVKVGSLKGEIELDDLISGDVDVSQKTGKKSLGLISMVGLGFFGLSFIIYWISWFKIFGNFGQSGWKAFIPILNIFVFTKIVEKPAWWLIIYLIFPIGFILSSTQISKLYNKKILFLTGLILMPIIFFPLLAFKKN